MKYPIILIAAIIYTLFVTIFGVLAILISFLWSGDTNIFQHPFTEYYTTSKREWDWFPVFVKCNPNRYRNETYKSYFHWIWGIN